MRIGIFDSGIGGLCLLLGAARALPKGEFIYYADTDNVPYGEKPREVIASLSDRAVEHLRNNGANAVVVACNTATSAAISDLRKKHENGEGAIPIVGMEPAVKRAIDLCEGGRILAAATPLTVGGTKLKSLLERFDTRKRTDTIPLPGLVRLAESGNFEGGYHYIAEELADASIDLSLYSALVLGCTHFNYFKDSFARLLPEGTRIVDGNEGTVNQLLRRLGLEKNVGVEVSVDDIMRRTEFYTSGRRITDNHEIARIKKALERLELMERI